MLKQLGLTAELPVIEDWHAVLVSGQPLLDVRAPVEFGAGAFPGSVNLPLINDTEREAVGRCYKQAGQDAAIALGLALISGDVKAGRIAAWKTFLQAVPAPERVLYCFRGGLRSRIAQQWIYAHTGLVCPRIRGGYKALRRYLLDQLEILPGQFQNWVLSGRTGCGKTRFLSDFRQQIDLEGLANHRGSAFGPNITPQPTQIAFENALAIALLRQRDAGQPALLFEDESRNIGSVHLPPSLLEALRESPLVVLDTPDEERLDISFQAYVLDMIAAYGTALGSDDAGLQAYGSYLFTSLGKIRKRLGDVRYQQVHHLMAQALAEQSRTGKPERHRDWVRFILFDYYDPMYDYQLKAKRERIRFQGDAVAVREYLAARTPALC